MQQNHFALGVIQTYYVRRAKVQLLVKILSYCNEPESQRKILIAMYLSRKQ